MSCSTKPAPMPDLLVLRGTIDGATQWFLTSDVAMAHKTLLEMGALDIAEMAPTVVIREQYGELALLGMVG